jgi:hypothetical protein
MFSMKTASKKGFAMGALVVIEEAYIALFESFDLRNVICEIVDSRLMNGTYVYQVAPVGSVLHPRVEVYSADIRPYRP